MLAAWVNKLNIKDVLVSILRFICSFFKCHKEKMVVEIN